MIICVRSALIFGFVLLLGMSMSCKICSALTRLKVLFQFCKPIRYLLLLFGLSVGFVVFSGSFRLNVNV